MRRREERGFTLPELLVAMAFGLTVLAGVYTFYVSHIRVYAVQDQLLESHQNLRIALELIVDDIQGAGGTGISSAAAVTVNNSSTGPDSLSLLIPDSTICSPPTLQVIPISDHPGASSNMFLEENSVCPEMLRKRGIVISADGFNYRTIEITQVTIANDKIDFSPGLLPMNSAGGLGADYTDGTLVLLQQVTYTIDLSDPTKPVLRRNFNNGAGAQPLANYIEDMQVALGYDRNSDGVISEIGGAADDDEWVFNVAGESNATEAPTNLRAIRIILVGRTRLPDPQFQGSLPAIFDRAGGGIDRYRRKTRGTQVQIRNLRSKV